MLDIGQVWAVREWSFPFLLLIPHGTKLGGKPANLEPTEHCMQRSATSLYRAKQKRGGEIEDMQAQNQHCQNPESKAASGTPHTQQIVLGE